MTTPNPHTESFVVFLKDGSIEEWDLPLDSSGDPITKGLPQGAKIIQPTIPFAGSSFGSFGSSDGLPDRLNMLRPVYDAVGRIGVKQTGLPTGNEKMFGTGILVSRRHVLTNAHVASQIIRDNFLSDFGIEFEAEKNSDISSFFSFSDVMPRCVLDFDAAILTLAEPISFESRPYISMSRIEINELKDREIAAIGYPKNKEITRSNLIRATKRVSSGHIFKHSKTKGSNIAVSIDDMKNGAICHNASTLGGNSGSAIVDILTGEVIALHFAGRVLFNDAEDTNLAIPAIHLAEEIKSIVSKWL